MDSRATDVGAPDWTEDIFNSTQYDDTMNTDSPFGSSAFDQFTNLETFAESPGIAMRTPIKEEREHTLLNQRQQFAQHGANPPASASASAESSPQDSASDSSSRRKRKVTTESPITDDSTTTAQPVMKEDSYMEMGDVKNGQQHFDQVFTRPMGDLSLEQDAGLGTHYDFGSSDSSPEQHRGFGAVPPLHSHANIPVTSMASQYQQSPIQTIDPGMFQFASRSEQSPIMTNTMFNGTPDNDMFSTPSSESTDTFKPNQQWNNPLQQATTWPVDYSGQFAAAGALGGFTPSPVTVGMPSMVPRGAAMSPGRSPLHIAPVVSKSRVETQINIVMTLERPPPGIEYLHLPLHTIAKSKLLAKEDIDEAKTLELHTMLVCTSAMHNPQFQEKALRRAAAQNNKEIQDRGESLRDTSDDEKNDMKNVPEEDRPANGGEVRICGNCIQRERKRAGRKKLKKEEEQQHWERYETERVVVFNSQEHLPFKLFDPSHRDVTASAEEQRYNPPEGALQVTAAMRIACYCRHQSEKEGFRVIFTLKDIHGNVVAQQISDSILITDDHKTHPQAYSTPVPGDVYYANPAYAQNGLGTSYSMIGLSDHQGHGHHAHQGAAFTSSRSTGNLQAMAHRAQQYNPQSHVHQLPSSGYASQTTSATMTPTSMSRPASPVAAGQAGPNKKRKSSTFHRRVPSGLTMTPRVDTNQPPSSNLPSASMSVTSPFSPPGTFSAQADGSYMTIPHNGNATQYWGSGPPTPNEKAHAFNFTQTQLDGLTRAQNASAYFSHPSSAVPSRASSPVLSHTRPNMAAYARQPIQTPTNTMINRQPFHTHNGPVNTQPSLRASGSSLGNGNDDISHANQPTISKITPAEGPSNGGTEVSIFGYNFTSGMQVQFGDQLAVTAFYGPQALLAVAPPSRAGGVDVSLVNTQQPSQQNGGGANSQSQQQRYSSPPATGQRQIFTYTDTNPRVMEMALRFLSQQHRGNQALWNRYTNEAANQYLQSNASPAGIHPQGGYGGGAS